MNLPAAIIAGFTVITLMSPIWLVKTRMQLQTADGPTSGQYANYRNMTDCFRRVVREEGFRGLYKGLSASYLGISESSIQFVLYEQGKKMVLSHKKKGGISDDKLSTVEYLTVAGIAKLVASALTYPHEVIRTRIREQRVETPDYPHKYKGVFQGLKVLAVEEGVKGLYGGMAAHLLRVVPNAAIMFFTYEMVVKFLSGSPESKK